MEKLTKFFIVFILMLFVSSVAIAQDTIMSEKDYDQYLIKALKEKNVGVRASAAQLIGDRKVQEAVEPLIKMLKNEQNKSARIVAALALYKIGDERVLPVLKKFAKCEKCKTAKHVMTAIVYEMQTVQLAQE
jgi:hypothetical protein